MRFLCDVHISYKLTKHLIFLGFEALHVNEILDKSETKDAEICKYADLQMCKFKKLLNTPILYTRAKKLQKWI